MYRLLGFHEFSWVQECIDFPGFSDFPIGSNPHWRQSYKSSISYKIVTQILEADLVRSMVKI